MSITVTNKYKPDPANKATTVYCGRGSALGNPFPMRDGSDRDRVCNNYEEWFKNMVDPIMCYNDEARRMTQQLNIIKRAASKGDVYLQCFCAPKRCHCDTIKKYIEENL